MAWGASPVRRAVVSPPYGCVSRSAVNGASETPTPTDLEQEVRWLPGGRPRGSPLRYIFVGQDPRVLPRWCRWQGVAPRPAERFSIDKQGRRGFGAKKGRTRGPSFQRVEKGFSPRCLSF